MAGITSDPNGRKRIQFTGADGKRRTLRLGKLAMRDAEAFNVRVERLIAATLGHPPDDDTLKWLAGLDSKMLRRLERGGLVESNARRNPTLRALLDEFFATLDVKPGTETTYRQTRKSLEGYFGELRLVRTIDELDADKWRKSLKTDGLAEATISRRVKTARQIFKQAIRWKMLGGENPFRDVKAGPQSNRQRMHFIPRDVAQRVLDACPDAQWRLLFALSRYGGLRCPSEHLGLRWGDVDWEHGCFLVRSPKTEHYEGGESRLVPLFPELRPYLLAVFEEAEPGTEYAITRYRRANANLRTQLERIMSRAGVKPWPRLFHNLRSTRQTELEDRFPSKAVCEWMGNSQKVARDHYLQTTDEHFARAAAEETGGARTAQKATRQPAAAAGTGSQMTPAANANRPDLPGGASGCDLLQDSAMTPTGFEPVSRP